VYLVDSELLKSSKLTNDYLKIEILEKTFDLGPPYNSTINIYNLLSPLDDPTIYLFFVFCFKFNRKHDPNNLQVKQLQN